MSKFTRKKVLHHRIPRVISGIVVLGLIFRVEPKNRQNGTQLLRVKCVFSYNIGNLYGISYIDIGTKNLKTTLKCRFNAMILLQIMQLMHIEFQKVSDEAIYLTETNVNGLNSVV